MLNRRRLSWFAFSLVFLANCSVGQCHPAEPQATFSLKNGWVEFTLRQAGRPVANATIQIIGANGAPFGDGETGEEGQTAFPLPPGASFVVEIKAADRTADPIRLFKNDSGVEPGRVLLSYGLRPCCRSIKLPGDVITVGAQSETPSAAHEETTSWSFLVPVFAGVSIGLVFLFMVWRR